MKHIQLFEEFINEAEFPAQFAIDDNVIFTTGPDEEPRYGKVAKVSFTKAKVWYDILDDYTGTVIKEIDSVFIKPIVQNNLKESSIVNESNKYLINVEYRVKKSWYTDPLEVLKTTMHFNTEIYSYEIKSTEYESDDFVADIKIISKIDKPALRKWLDGHSTRAEKYTIK